MYLKNLNAIALLSEEEAVIWVKGTLMWAVAPENEELTRSVASCQKNGSSCHCFP